MPRFKPVHRSKMVVPLVLEDQVQARSFDFAMDGWVDTELELLKLDQLFNNDEAGASVYDSCVVLKIVLLAYSRRVRSSYSTQRILDFVERLATRAVLEC